MAWVVATCALPQALVSCGTILLRQQMPCCFAGFFRPAPHPLVRVRRRRLNSWMLKRRWRWGAWCPLIHFHNRFVLHFLLAAQAVELGRVVLAVGGMTCASCVLSLETVLRQLPGVQQVEVNLATGQVRLHCNLGVGACERKGAQAAPRCGGGPGHGAGEAALALGCGCV